MDMKSLELAFIIGFWLLYFWQARRTKPPVNEENYRAKVTRVLS